MEPIKKKSRYQKMVDLGLCPLCCRRPGQEGSTMCIKCRETRRKQSKRHYAKYRTKYAAMAREKYQAKLATRPPKPPKPEPVTLPPLPSKEWLRARVALLEGTLAQAGIDVANLDA